MPETCFSILASSSRKGLERNKIHASALKYVLFMLKCIAYDSVVNDLNIPSSFGADLE